ncbi:hypothetical protein [Paraflavitalea speifideaquila]|uniref:hypothetical protein n=1 Tax=Paraflavitalea speifideaquila TaxID=3076558 RepID=UPI0028E57FBF|nr:hypothetical protein [Paraflavitalea speifideiaquila]
MKNKIERTLFWFKVDEGELLHLNEKYFAIATLLNRLLNDRYRSDPIKFINIYFANNKYYEKYPAIPSDYVHYFKKNGGTLAYYGLFDLTKFNSLSVQRQNDYIWEKACRYLEYAAISIKNNDLIDAVRHAFQGGKEIHLNPDYRLVESEVIIYGQLLKAAIWVNFKADGMYSKMTLEKGDQIIFEKSIDETKMGLSFFFLKCIKV